MNKRIVKVFIAFIIFFIVYVANNYWGLLSIPQRESNMKDYQFNIITVSTVFAGFSFTVLGILLSFSSTKTIEEIKETSILVTQCNIVVDSIIMFVISAFISLFLIFIAYSEFITSICTKVTSFNLHENVINVLYVMGMGYLIYGIILFTVSVKRMVVIMRQVFAEDIKRGKEKANKFKSIAKRQEDNISKFQQEEYEKDTFSSE